jgi:Flp pilus assembly protein TadD
MAPVKRVTFGRRTLLAIGICLVCLVGIAVAVARLARKNPPDFRKLSIAQLRALTESHPTLTSLGVLFQRTLDAGNNREALDIARKLVHQFPNDGRAYNLLGIGYAANNDSADARSAFNKSISLEPRRIEPYVNLGKLALSEGDSQKAASEFDRATAVDPKSASAWTGLGDANVDMQNMQDAIDAFQHAISLAPNRPQAYGHLGAFLAELGRGVEARPNLQRALALGDHSAPVYAGLAMALADQPQSQTELQQALDYADQAEKLGSTDGLVYYARGLALQRLGRYKEAIASYRQNIEVSANANGAWIGISQCYRALGHTKLADEAAKTGERVLAQRQRLGNLRYQIKATPARIDLHEQYADAEMAAHEYLVAADQYRYVAQHSPDKPSEWLKAAHAMDLAGNKELAEYMRTLAHTKPIAQNVRPIPSNHSGQSQ